MSSTGAASAEPVRLTDADAFDAHVADGVVLVDFYADWCGPCQMMEPAVEAVAADAEATVLKVDVDRHRSLAGEYGVQSVPTLLVFDDGEPVERMVGAQSERALSDAIESHTA
jgi:thioredoxin 1